jgi:hypothetical protein
MRPPKAGASRLPSEIGQKLISKQGLVGRCRVRRIARDRARRVEQPRRRKRSGASASPGRGTRGGGMREHTQMIRAPRGDRKPRRINAHASMPSQGLEPEPREACLRAGRSARRPRAVDAPTAGERCGGATRGRVRWLGRPCRRMPRTGLGASQASSAYAAAGPPLGLLRSPGER